MNSKKVTAFILMITLLLSTFLLSACTKKEEEPVKTQDDINQEIDSKLEAYKTDLIDSAESMKNNDDVRDYLINWAKTKSVSYRTDDSGNVIMGRKASKGYEDADPVIIVCPYDAEQFQAYVYPAAMALYIIKNNEGSGKLRIVFTPETRHHFEGIHDLSDSWFKGHAKVFTLNASKKGMISLASGAGSTYRFTQKISRTKPSYTTAYKIRYKNLPSGQPDSKLEEQINPVTRLNTLLATLKNKNIAYEVAFFRGGTSDVLYATSATLKIVIDPNKEAAFIEYMTSLSESFQENYGKDYPDAALTFKKIDTPKNVIQKNDTGQLVGFVYTLLHGIYQEAEDGTPLAFVNVSSIRTDNNTAVIESCAASLDETVLKEIDTDEKTLCSLSNVKFKKTSSIPAWNSGEENHGFSSAFINAFIAGTDKNLTYLDSVAPTQATFVQEKNPKANIINITLNDNVLSDCTKAVVRYMMDNKAPAETDAE